MNISLDVIMTESSSSIPSNLDIIRDVSPIELKSNDLSMDFPIYESEEFKKIRIYGTIEDPLFIARDIRDALNLKNLHIEREQLFKWGEDIVKIRIQTSGGRQEAVAFTEKGLTTMVYQSRSPIASTYRMFIYLVMKRLRLKGVVTIKEAKVDLSEYQAKVIELEKTKAVNEEIIRRLDQDLEREHKAYMATKTREESNFNQWFDARYRCLKLEESMKYADAKDTSEFEAIVKGLEKMYMKKIYVSAQKAPKEVHNEYPPDEYDHETTELEYDDIMPLGVFDKPGKGKEIGILYMPKEYDLASIRELLPSEARVKKSDSTEYQNIWVMSFDEMDRLMKDEKRKFISEIASN